LEETYLRYCEKLASRLSRNPQQLLRAKILLRWLVCSPRPFTVVELSTAIYALRGAKGYASAELMSELLLRKTLGSLIEIREIVDTHSETHHDTLESFKSREVVVRLIHASLKEFLVLGHSLNRVGGFPWAG